MLEYLLLQVLCLRVVRAVLHNKALVLAFIRWELVSANSDKGFSDLVTDRLMHMKHHTFSHFLPWLFIGQAKHNQSPGRLGL